MVTVFAARIGPRAVAKMAVMDRTKVMRSRFQSGQLRGSFGSSEGWGIWRGGLSAGGGGSRCGP